MISPMEWMTHSPFVHLTPVSADRQKVVLYARNGDRATQEASTDDAGLSLLKQFSDDSRAMFLSTFVPRIWLLRSPQTQME